MTVDEVLSSDVEGIDDDDDDCGNESDFELVNDFSNGESETDSTDANARGVPRGVGRGCGRGGGRGGDRPMSDSPPGWTRATAMNASLHLMSNEGLKIY